MGQLRITHEPVCRLTFTGRMTFDVARKLEDGIIAAMRRYQHIEVDLSGVEEIDLSGIHLLGLMQDYGGNKLQIIATSPAVELASKRLLGSFRGASLGRTARQEAVARK